MRGIRFGAAAAVVVAALSACGGGGGSSAPETGGGGGNPPVLNPGALTSDPTNASGFVQMGAPTAQFPAERAVTTGVQLKLKAGVTPLPQRFEDNIVSATDTQIVVSVNAGQPLTVGKTYITDNRSFRIVAMRYENLADILTVAPVGPMDLVDVFELAITSSASSQGQSAQRARALSLGAPLCPQSIYDIVTTATLEW
jgi:hypothetical protein